LEENVRLLWYIPGFESQLLRPCSIRALAIGKALTQCNELSFLGIVSPQLNAPAQLSNRLELIPISKNPIFIFRQLINIIKKKDVNIVQERLGCHYLYSDWGILAGNYMGLPTVGELHEYPPTFLSKVLSYIRLRHSLKACDRIFVINKIILRYLPLRQDELKKIIKKVVLIPNGYDASIACNITDLKLINAAFPRDKKLVGYFGDLNEKKGVDVILDLIQHIDDRFFFLIAGRGQLEREVKRLSQLFPQRLKYLGYLSPEKTYYFMSLCHVTLALYPQKLKTGKPQYVNPLKVYESLAVGTPVVISEAVLSMLPREVADLCVVVSRTGLKELFTALDVACRQKFEKKTKFAAVLQKYSWDYLAKNLLAPTYEALISN